MTDPWGGAITWLALGLGLLLVPIIDQPLARARRLSERGRLVGPVAPVSARARPPRPAAIAVLASALATATVTVLAGPVLGAAAAVATATAGRLLLVTLRARTVRRHDVDRLSALHLLAAELAAGSRPSAAFDAAALACPAHADDFVSAAEAARGGHDPALRAPELRGLAQAWSVALVTGAPLASAVGRVADDLAARIEQRRLVSSSVAGAQSSAAMLAGLPILGLLLGSAMQAGPLEVLLGARAGQLLCLLGVSLDAAGVLWTQRLTTRAGRA